MANVIESLKGADMVVFASPIYWFDITAQEKAALSRGADPHPPAPGEEHPPQRIGQNPAGGTVGA